MVGFGGSGVSEGITVMGLALKDLSVFFRCVTVLRTVTSSEAIKLLLLFLEMRVCLFLGGRGEEVICSGGRGRGSGVVKPLSTKVLMMATSEDELVDCVEKASTKSSTSTGSSVKSITSVKCFFGGIEKRYSMCSKCISVPLGYF
jgi:hypothetical protein